MKKKDQQFRDGMISDRCEHCVVGNKPEEPISVRHFKNGGDGG